MSEGSQINTGALSMQDKVPEYWLPAEVLYFKEGYAIAGGHFGDEGKGKITDLLVEKCKKSGKKTFNPRYQGGGNAGHTVKRDGQEYHFHYLPSGALQCDIILLGGGMLIDPFKLDEEIEQIPDEQKEKIYIDGRATICSSLERFMDGYYESQRKQNKDKIGTTGSGVGPAVSERALRVDIRLAAAKACKNWQELKELFAKIPNIPYEVVQQIAAKHGSFDKYVEDLYNAIQKLNIIESAPFHEKMKKEGYVLILEVSQAFGLDCIHGNTGKYVTSTHTTVPGALADGGLGINDVPNGIYIITKAYSSKVGGGYFATKFGHGEDDGSEDVAQFIYDTNGECGVTTGRKRDLGWFDCVAVHAALMANGTNKLVINCMDTIGLIPGKLAKVCYAYRHKKTGEITRNWPFFQEEYEPLYTEIDVDWDIYKCRDEKLLPDGVWVYLGYISYYTGAEICFIGTGGSNEDIIEISEYGKEKIAEVVRKISTLYQATAEIQNITVQMENPTDEEIDEYGEDENKTSNSCYVIAAHSEDKSKCFVVYQDVSVTSGLLFAKPMDNVFKEEKRGLPQFDDGNYDIPEFPEGREVTAGSIWRHFKGTTAKVIGVARNTENGEYYVVYECTGNAGKTNHKDGVLARPIDMFLSPTDRKVYPDKEKYPQDNRFERIK